MDKRLFYNRDGYSDIIGGVGTNKSALSRITTDRYIKKSEQEIETLLNDYSTVSNLIDIKVQDTFKKYPIFSYDIEINNLIFNYFIDHNLFKHMINADKQRLAFGSSCILLDYDATSEELLEPLNLNTLSSKEIRFFVLNKYQFNNLENKKYYESDFYKIINKSNAETIYHKSRIIKFEGIYKTENLKNINNGHNAPWLSGELLDACKIYSSTAETIFNLIKESSLGILQIDSLTDNLDSKEEYSNTKILTQLSTIQISKGAFNDLVIDKRDDYKRVNYNFAGLKDIIETQKSTISYLSNIPKTRLFGDNPQGGIGGQGDSQLRDYYDEINYRQRHELLPSLKQLTQIVCSILKIDYSKLNISFPSLWELTEQEKSDINLKNKQADSILTDNIIKMKTNMITPEDINNYKLLIDSMK